MAFRKNGGFAVLEPTLRASDLYATNHAMSIMYKQQYQYIVCGSLSIKYISNYLSIHLFVNH
jgi:hypothetical protein